MNEKVTEEKSEGFCIKTAGKNCAFFCLKTLFRVFYLTLFLLVVLIIIGFIWLKTGERQIPYIEKIISTELGKSKEGLRFDWERNYVTIDDDNDLVIKLIEPNLIEKDKSIFFSNFISTKVNLYKLIGGKLVIKSLKLNDLKLDFYKKEGVEKADNSSQDFKSMYKIISSEAKNYIDKNRSLNLNELDIKNLTIILPNGIFYKFPSLKVLLSKQDKTIVGEVILDEKLGGMELDAKVTLDSKKHLKSELNAKNFRPALLANLNDNLKFLNAIEKTLNAKIQSEVNEEGRVKNITTDLYTNFSEESDEYISYTAYADYNSDLGGYVVKNNAKINSMPMERLGIYWPDSLIPEAREWVTQNIYGGEYSSMRSNFTFCYDVKENCPLRQKTLLNYKGATIKYMDDLPKLEQVEGIIRSTSTKYLDIFLTKAKVLNSDIISSSARITLSTETEPTYFDLIAEVNGDANDLTQYAKIAGEEAYNMVKEITGKAQTQLELALPLKKGMDPEFNIYTDVTEFKFPNMIEGISASEGDISLVLNNEFIDISGTANVNSIESDLRYNQKLKSSEIKADVKYKGELTEVLKSFDNYIPESIAKPLISGGSGVIKGNTTFKKKGDNNNLNTSLNLDDVQFTMPMVNWYKGRGAKLKADLKFEGNGNSLEIKQIKLDGDRISALASGIVDTSDGSREIKFDYFKWGRTDAQISYKITDPFFEFKVKGAALDLSNLNFKELSDSGKVKAEEFNKDRIDKTHFSANLDIDNIYLKRGFRFKNSKLNLDCISNSCNTASISAVYGDGEKVNLSYNDKVKKTYKEGRDLSLNITSFGDILGGLGITNNIKGGNLSITGKAYGKKDIQNGKLKLEKFRVIDSPSNPNFLINLSDIDALKPYIKDDGFYFRKLLSDYTFFNDLLFLKHLRLISNTIGLTAKGRVDFDKEDYKIIGSFVPLYVVNSMLGKIPLLGDILVGEKGGGIIASRYTLKGTFDEPDFSVNPISVLTPGFLQRMWGDVKEEERDPFFKPAPAFLEDEIDN